MPFVISSIYSKIGINKTNESEDIKTVIIIRKKRYLIPFNKYTIELDVFDAPYENLIIAEVEFDSEEEAKLFQPPEWFEEDVTMNAKYHNSYLSRGLF